VIQVLLTSDDEPAAGAWIWISRYPDMDMDIQAPGWILLYLLGLQPAPSHLLRAKFNKGKPSAGT